MRDSVVGVVANPMSGRDIRRLVAKATVFPNVEKTNMVLRLLLGARAAGVDRALLSTDLGGVSAGVLRVLRQQRPSERGRYPVVEFLEQDRLTESAWDTTVGVRSMIARGAGVVVCLGGDGTARAAARACGDTPLLALSTGTNNAYPEVLEATVAGLAAGLVATGQLAADRVTEPSSVLEVTYGAHTEIALVDVCVSLARHVGSRALWDTSALVELYCTYAEPDAIGLSSVAGLLCPSPRSRADGVALVLGSPREARHVVRAPVAPGLVVDVGVHSWRPFRVGDQAVVTVACGVVAVDGERELEFFGDVPPVVRLRTGGPRRIQPRRVMEQAARLGLLVRSSAIPSTDRVTVLRRPA